MKQGVEGRFRNALAQGCGALASGFGLIALLGWAFNQPMLSSFGSRLIPMAPSTALLFVLMGVAVYFHAHLSYNHFARRAGLVLGCLGVFVSISLFSLASQGIYLEIEHLGFQIGAALNGTPIGHMSPVTALSFLFANLSFLLLLMPSSGHPLRTLQAFGFAVLVILTNYVFALAYFAGLPLLYAENTIPPALPTNLAFLTLGTALLASFPAQAGPRDKMKEAISTRFPYVIFLVFVILILSIVTIGYLYYRNYEQQYRAQLESQLSAIADLKVSGLENWRAERLADAEVLYHNPAFAALVQRFFDNPDNPQARVQLQAWLDTIQNSHRYDRVFLLDLAGVERISSPTIPGPVDSHLTQEAAAIIHAGQVIFLDLHRDTTEDTVHLALLVPIFAEQDTSHPVGLLVLSIDPETYLNPYLQLWPVPSESAETLLVRREGENVLYLNALRFHQDAALELRFPLDNPQLPAARAVLGEQGVIDGLDYRGVPVVADIRPVPNSPWFLVSKIDIAEVYAPLTARLWQTVIFFGALMLALGAGLVLVWRQQRLRYYRGQLETLEALRESEDKFKDVFDYSVSGKSITKLSGEVNVNRAFCEMLGYSQEELKGRKWQEITHPDDMELTQNMVNALLAGEKALRFTKRYIHKNGSVIWTDVGVTLRRDKDGIPQYFITTVSDITERKQAEEKLIVSELRYRRLFEAARDGILILNAETGVIEDVNPFLVEMLGFSREDILGKELWELGFFKDIAASKANFLELQQKEYIRFEGLPLEMANGRKLYVEFVSNVYRVNHHKVVQCNIRDITERKQAEKARQQSEVLFQTLFELSPDAVVILDPHDPNVSSPIVDCNAAACLMNGYQRDELVGQPIDLVNADPYTKAGQTAYLKELREAGNLKLEVLHRHKNGTIFPVEVSTTLIKVGERELVIGIDRDIAERKRAEDALRESEKRFRSLFENMLNGFAYCQMLFDQGRPQDFIYLDVNHAFETLTGLKDVIGKKVSEVIPGIRESDPGLFEIYGRVALTGKPESFETYVDALEMWFFISVYSPQKEYFVAVFDVITERKRAEQELKIYAEHLEEMVEQRTRELREAQDQLVRQERLAMLGQLAGSVSHELRNPLGVISNAIYFLNMALPGASDKVREYLGIISDETHAANKIITDLLDFSRIKSADRGPVSAADLVQHVLERFSLPREVSLKLNLVENLPSVHVDSGQMSQVLGNLLVNACQSMPEGGSLVIGGKLSSIDAQPSIAISIQDTGEGITPENMDKLFQPLFTTKAKGIGLGLVVCKNLVEINGGRIEVESVVGQGSTFTIHLPVHELASAPANPPESLTRQDKESK